MLNNTKQNVVASSDYECRIWGGGQKKPGVGERDRTGRIYEGSTTELKAYSEGQKEPMNEPRCLNVTTPGIYF